LSYVQLAYVIVGAALVGFFSLFVADSIRWKRHRAIYMSFGFMTMTSGTWVGWWLLVNDEWLLNLPSAMVLLVALLFFLPIGRAVRIDMGQSCEKVDERDTMFAREDYVPGTHEYETYYRMRPKLKDIDDRIRSLPPLCKPGGRYYEPRLAAEIDSIFTEIRSWTSDVDGKIVGDRVECDPRRMSKEIERRALDLGAAEVGIARLNPRWIYSHVGRGPEEWGSPITLNHRFAVAFTVEMDYDHVESAPGMSITEETAHRYRDAARISIQLAAEIRAMGYQARAHISGSNYQIMLPPVAHDAGLGELGRHGYLISRIYGSRVRLGAITTNLPLVVDKPISFGVQGFCEECRKCADNCPSGSIQKGGRSRVRGVEKWPLDIESCFRYWRLVGTDCGLCMRVCPFSHPRSVIHGIIRYAVSRSPFARRVSLVGDDLFYGKRQMPDDDSM
jgi:ferredoxin/uncharacterized membrane protein